MRSTIGPIAAAAVAALHATASLGRMAGWETLASGEHMKAFDPTPAAETGVRDASGRTLDELSGPEIRQMISGKSITPDPDVQQTTLQFAERFGPDGTWTSSRQQRAALIRHGRWWTEQDKLCVAATGEAEHRRSVWLDRRSGRIVLGNIGAGATPDRHGS